MTRTTLVQSRPEPPYASTQRQQPQTALPARCMLVHHSNIEIDSNDSLSSFGRPVSHKAHYKINTSLTNFMASSNVFLIKNKNQMITKQAVSYFSTVTQIIPIYDTLPLSKPQEQYISNTVCHSQREKIKYELPSSCSQKLTSCHVLPSKN